MVFQIQGLGDFQYIIPAAVSFFLIFGAALMEVFYQFKLHYTPFFFSPPKGKYYRLYKLSNFFFFFFILYYLICQVWAWNDSLLPGEVLQSFNCSSIDNLN